MHILSSMLCVKRTEVSLGDWGGDPFKKRPGMDQYLGLRVRLALSDGAIMEGQIMEVNEATQTLLLSGVTCENSGHITRYPGLLEVFGSDICELEVLPTSSEAIHLSNLLAPIRSSFGAGCRNGPTRSPVKDNDVGNIDLRLMEPLRSSTGARSRNGSPRKAAKNSWNADDVRKIKSEEFDFQANLRLFDKQKVFSEIKAKDKTDVAKRLVSHNLSGRTKLRHDENVLGPSIDDDEEDFIDEKLLKLSLKAEIDPKSALRLRSSLRGEVLDVNELESVSNHHQSFKASDLQPVLIELAGKALALHIVRHHAPKTAQFLVGQRPLLDAICYAATKHLLMSGVAMNFIETEETQGKSGSSVHELTATSLNNYKSNVAYYVHNSNRAKHQHLNRHEHGILVDATGTGNNIPLNHQFEHIIALDNATTPSVNGTSMISWDLHDLQWKAAHLHKHHPHCRLFLLNAGNLDCPELARLFQSKEGHGYEDEIQLVPFIK